MATPMTYRSTNADGRFVHFGGALVAGVEFGNGIELNPSSTGASPVIQPCGDDAAINLILKGKGTGGVLLGSTAAGAVAFKGAVAQVSTYSHGAIGESRSLEITLASTTIDVNTGDLLSVGLVIDTANLSSAVNLASWRLSTVATSRFTAVLSNVQSTATSTGSGSFQFAWLDLT